MNCPPRQKRRQKQARQTRDDGNESWVRVTIVAVSPVHCCTRKNFIGAAGLMRLVNGLATFVTAIHGPATFVADCRIPPPLQPSTKFDPLKSTGALNCAGGTVTVAMELVTALRSE